MDNNYSAPKSDISQNDVNTSGMGKDHELPEGISGWSWGAGLLNVIWALGNRTWIGLFAFIPYAGFIMCLVLAFKGREWAWRNKKWDSVEHFQSVQRKWSFWAFVLYLNPISLGFIAAIVLPAFY